MTVLTNDDAVASQGITIQGSNIMAKADNYNLDGRQVEPDASYWSACEKFCLAPRPVMLKELTDLTDKKEINGNPNPHYFPRHPDPNTEEGKAIIQGEVEELQKLEQFRDEPNMLSSREDGGTRCPLSLFLQLRPQPIGSVINTARETGPVIRTGRELARFFENNTPGESHRQAMSYLIGETGFSPPRQAWLWAGLDITVYSALVAAWYYKWRSPRPNTSRRQRPVEYEPSLNVLFDFPPNSTNSDDLPPRRVLDDGRPPIPPRPIVPPFPLDRQGTPRHPAYPSGHSTYAGAASEYMSFFFPDYRKEFDHLADNAGLARLWAGIHYRSDHVEGLKLGRTVAALVIRQMQLSGNDIVPREPDMLPPTRDVLEQRTRAFIDICGDDRDPGVLEPICAPSLPVALPPLPEPVTQAAGQDARQAPAPARPRDSLGGRQSTVS